MLVNTFFISYNIIIKKVFRGDKVTEKHKMSLNISAELVMKVKIKAAMSNTTLTEEIEKALEKHTADINLSKIIKTNS